MEYTCASCGFKAEEEALPLAKDPFERFDAGDISNCPIRVADFDLRQVSGAAIKPQTVAEVAKSRTETPSPTGDEFPDVWRGS